MANFDTCFSDNGSTYFQSDATEDAAAQQQATKAAAYLLAPAQRGYGYDEISVTTNNDSYESSLPLAVIYFLHSSSAVQAAASYHTFPLTIRHVVAQLKASEPGEPLQAGNVAVRLLLWPFSGDRYGPGPSGTPPARLKVIARDLYLRISTCLPQAQG